ncbi:MAG: glycosyltransferase [Chloroflexi bacterium]|nr:glycosyltransferase [Chloroflexota bacterium]
MAGGTQLTVGVSVIATVKNESGSIARLLESLSTQTRLPDEVVIVDGGSADDTLSQLQAWKNSGRLPLRVLVEPGCNISRGRNLAIAAAQGPIIASTDAGVRLDPSWLANLVQPFLSKGLSNPAPIVACGFFAPEATTVFEIAMAATVLPDLADVNPAKFLPSSRSVAFLKSAWEAVGGYPEWLDYCEDLIFDFRLRARGYPFIFVPHAVAYFRPRSNLRAFFTQYYRYARGDGKADLWRKRHAVRYATYLIALPLLLWLAIRQNPLWAIPLALGAAIMFWTPYKRLWRMVRSLPILDKCKAICLVPIIRVTGDIAKMLGYPVGIYWRWQHRHELPRWRD